MPMTTWRIYYAHVENMGDHYLVSIQNMFGREIKQKTFATGSSLRRFLRECKEREPKFSSNYDF